MHFLPTYFTDRGVGKSIILQTLDYVGVGNGLKLLLCYLRSLLAKDVGKFLFTTIQFELSKSRISET